MNQVTGGRDCLKRSMLLVANVIEWACMTVDGSEKLCFIKVLINSEIHQGINSQGYEAILVLYIQ